MSWLPTGVVDGLAPGSSTITASLPSVCKEYVFTPDRGCICEQVVTLTGQSAGTVQIPTSLSIVAGTNSPGSEGACTTTGGLNGCGLIRTFMYQVNDQNGNPITVANMTVGDVICNTGTNGSNLQGYITTCGGTTGACWGTAGPCNKFTNASGQFPEQLSVCAPACISSGTCCTAGQTIASQTWTVDGYTLNSDVKSLTYKCNSILVNGN